jgi:ribonuclease P protein component
MRLHPENDSQAGAADHETNLPSIQDSPRSHAWLPRSHEDSWWSGSDQRPEGERPQAPRALNPVSRGIRQAIDPVEPKLRLGRLSERHEFEATLRRAPLVASAHFELYYKKPTVPVGLRHRPIETVLSTPMSHDGSRPVDNQPARLGIVVPKRFSRRAVTRSLLKRQIRAAVGRHLAHLDTGIWIVRQRAQFQSAAEGSAASQRLKLSARRELDGMLDVVRQRKLTANPRAG